MATKTSSMLDGSALVAWRSYLQSHASIMRVLDHELATEHGLTARDYDVLLYLAHAEDRRLAMSELAESTLLTRSGITRLVDGLVACGLVERVACGRDARVSYAQITDAGLARMRAAGRTHAEGIRREFLAHYSEEEIEQLAELLRRLPGVPDGGSCTVE